MAEPKKTSVWPYRRVFGISLHFQNSYFWKYKSVLDRLHHNDRSELVKKENSIEWNTTDFEINALGCLFVILHFLLRHCVLHTISGGCFNLLSLWTSLYISKAHRYLSLCVSAMLKKAVSDQRLLCMLCIYYYVQHR